MNDEIKSELKSLWNGFKTSENENYDDYKTIIKEVNRLKEFHNNPTSNEFKLSDDTILSFVEKTKTLEKDEDKLIHHILYKGNSGLGGHGGRGAYLSLIENNNLKIEIKKIFISVCKNGIYNDKDAVNYFNNNNEVFRIIYNRIFISVFPETICCIPSENRIMELYKFLSEVDRPRYLNWKKDYNWKEKNEQVVKLLNEYLSVRPFSKSL